MATKVTPYVARDGTVSYRVRFRLARGVGNPVSETFTGDNAIVEATKFAAQVDQIGGQAARDLRRAVEAAQSPRTLATALDEHLDLLRASVTPGTIDKYKRIAAATWLPTLGALPVEAVTRDAVVGWVATQRAATTQRGGTYSTKSIKNAHSVLSAVLQREVDAGRLGRNVAHGVHMPTDKRQTIEKVFLSSEQFTILLDKIPDHYKLLVMTLYGTGMRWGEATALTPTKFNFEARPATVRVDQAWKQGKDSRPYVGTPKTRRSLRTITLPANLAKPLREQCERLAPNDYLFTTPRGVALRSGPFHTRVWQPAVKAAALGVKPRVHDLRHSHASALIAAGVSLPVVQRRLGHESIQTTIDVYGHLAPDAYAGATEAADVMLSQVLPQIDG